MSDIKASDVLAQLDACAKEFNFPVLDNGYIYPVTSRLSVFGNDKSWVIVVEVAGYHYRFPGHSGVENCQYVFGNMLPFNPGISYDNVLMVTADSDEGPTFIKDGIIDPAIHSMLIRDQQINIPKDPAFYASRGVTLKDPSVVNIYEFMRASLPENRMEFLATEDELYDSFRQDLPKLLQLDEWFHPDVAMEEKPSENETFRLIAAVLETGDIDLYKPEKSPNNHWSNWPYGGAV